MPTERPKFSVVVPIYRTAAYLPALLDSFRKQKKGSYEVEFIFIDDGSDDDGAEIASNWLADTGASGEVVRQENAGVSAARNHGISRATGDWITFPDSDDLINEDYFQAAAQAVVSKPASVLLSANVWHFQEGLQKFTDTHPLRAKFSRGNNPIDLNTQPNFIQSQAASAFFRLDLIRQHEIHFVDGLSVAEDAIFTSRYLLAAPAPRLVPLPAARYFYRKRAAASSAVDTYRTNPDYFFGRFERGYLPLLTEVAGRGRVPIWLQNTVLYDVGWFLTREQQVKFKATQLDDAEKQRVLELLRALLEFIDEIAILNYRITPLSAEVRALLLTLAGRNLPASGMTRIARDLPGALEVAYLFQGPLPQERLTLRGDPTPPRAAKTRKLDYFGQELLHERILRLPIGRDLTLFLDGTPQHLRRGRYFFGTTQISATAPKLKNRRSGGTPNWKRVLFSAAVKFHYWTRISTSRPGVAAEVEKLRTRAGRERIWNSAGTPKYRKKYGNGWLLLDQLRQGNDSAEYLYDYLRSKRPDINAWFVLDDQSPDWTRLQQKNARLIAYGSREHKIALQLADVVASTHLDVQITRPIAGREYKERRRPWRFVYLQHGVLQHNLAHWFNTKGIDLLTTASPDEHESIIGENTAYKLTQDSVVLTGFPRHDVVRNLADKKHVSDRKIILIAPTWRNSMHLPPSSDSPIRSLRTPFMQTAYAENWMGLLRDPQLLTLSQEHDAQVVFLPHPNLRTHLADVEFPPHVTVLATNPDVHELVASARVVVTDYSSIVFEGALAGARVIYFQFDREEFLYGGHNYVPGYWDYDVHGFGPVTSDAQDAVAQIAAGFLSETGEWPQRYQQRIERTLPHVDGGSADRIVKVIEQKFFTQNKDSKTK